MRALRGYVLVLALVVISASLAASGPIGVYAIVEKVVFEPSDQTPERVQVWGAFAYVDGQADGAGPVSPVRRGYMYFKIPEPGRNQIAANVVPEWRDLKSVAGTGQVVGFGNWMYIGAFEGLDPSNRVGPTGPPYLLETSPGRGWQTDMRVRPASEPPSAPAGYQSTGVVKIPAQGSRADLVKRLQDALKP